MKSTFSLALLFCLYGSSAQAMFSRPIEENDNKYFGAPRNTQHQQTRTTETKKEKAKNQTQQRNLQRDQKRRQQQIFYS